MAGFVPSTPGRNSHVGLDSTEEGMWLQNSISDLVRLDTSCKKLRAEFSFQKAMLYQTLLENEEIERQNAEMRNVASSTGPPEFSSLGGASASMPLCGVRNSSPLASFSTTTPALCHGLGTACAPDREASPEAGIFAFSAQSSSSLENVLGPIAELHLRGCPGPPAALPPRGSREAAEEPPEPEALQPPELDRGPHGTCEPEALMVQNLPLSLTREHLLQLWPADRSQCDFIYLPYNVKRRRITGHAFVNFSSGHAAAAFFERWHGQHLPGYCVQKKPLVVVRADVHGLEANLRHFAQNSGVTNEKYWPVVFRGAERVKMRDALAGLGLQYGGLSGSSAERDAEEGAQRQGERTHTAAEHVICEVRQSGGYARQVMLG